MRVWPKTAELGKLLVHPNGAAFRPDGSAEWPEDQFTTRRIAEGSVLIKDPHEKAEVKTKTDSPTGHST